MSRGVTLRALAGIALLLAAVARAAAAPSVTVADGAREQVVDLGALPRVRVTVADPTDGGRRATLEGVRLSAVLAALPAPPGADALEVRCDDGWLSLIPRALATARGPLLATHVVDGAGAHPLPAPRGPAFLVWPDAGAAPRDPVQAGDGWTFATIRLTWVTAARALAASAPPARSSAAVQQGAALYRRHCLHCHAMRGYGGMVGWDLAAPPIVAYRGAARVRAYVVDPRAHNPEGRMPAFRGKLGPGDLDALVAYLRAMR